MPSRGKRAPCRRRGSLTATRPASRSPQRRLSPRWRATATCGATTGSSPATASRATRATLRGSTWQRCAAWDRARFTAAPSRPCGRWSRPLPWQPQGPPDSPEMTRARRDLGDFGERVAAPHPSAKGPPIRERNFRAREGEIDIIAERGGTLVFVEVRTRRGGSRGTAVESITARKAAHLLAAAQAYAQANPDCPEDQRVDAIAGGG